MYGDILSHLADCFGNGLFDEVTVLPFLHTHIRQFVQPSVFPSVQSAVSVITSGPAWLQWQLKQLFDCTDGALNLPGGLSVVCKWNAMFEKKDFQVSQMCISIHIAGISGHLLIKTSIFLFVCSAIQPGGPDCRRYRSVSWTNRSAFSQVNYWASVYRIIQQGNQIYECSILQSFTGTLIKSSAWLLS